VLCRVLCATVCLVVVTAAGAAAQQRQAVPVSGESTIISLYLPGMRARTISLDAPTLFHTLSNDFFLEDDDTIYVQTGDIPAMWLRDSSAQTIPYERFVDGYQQLQTVTRGVIARDAKNIIIDPYANAFTSGYKPWEEKWEVDSLAYPIELIRLYWEYAQDRSIFTPRLHWAFLHIVETYECEQQHRSCAYQYRSRFLPNHGSGADYSDTGMIWCAFRPSDDPVRYPFNIPQELFAASALETLAHLALVGYGDADLAWRARELAAAVRAGVDRFGPFYDFRYGWIYAYEVDGKGGTLLMDDANLPDLISLTFLNLIGRDDPLYAQTRAFALSDADPYYYRGKYAAGLGSPHTPTGWIWPLAIATAGITSANINEVVESLEQIRALDGQKGLLYESVDPNHPWHFTRSEFGWANAMYAELVFRSVADLHEEPPTTELLFGLLPRGIHTPHVTTYIERWRAAATIYTALTRILQD